MAKEGSVAPKERINVTFKPATGGAQEEIELPLKLMVLGDFTQRADDRKIDWHYIAPGKPAQSAFIVGFNGRPARRALERDAISSMSRARAMLAAWRTDNDTERPHSLLRWQTPAVFSQTFVPQRGPTSGN